MAWTSPAADPANFLIVGGGLGIAACGAALFFGRREQRDTPLPAPGTTPLVTKAQDIHSS